MAYPIINAILQEHNADFCAAEVHGIATGLLCADINTDSSYWLNDLLPDDAPLPDEQKAIFIRLYEETRRLLTGDDFEFDLFLPDDNQPLLEKISALRSWCQGFLYGIGASIAKPKYSREAHEILKDIAEFTKLDSEAEDANEEDEVALMELTEFLRTAVLLLRAELNQQTDTD
jgi:uncharacterized protein YgfB (UPF0149 family)